MVKLKRLIILKKQQRQYIWSSLGYSFCVREKNIPLYERINIMEVFIYDKFISFSSSFNIRFMLEGSNDLYQSYG